jgi:hypothetical protein
VLGGMVGGRVLGGRGAGGWCAGGGGEGAVGLWSVKGEGACVCCGCLGGRATADARQPAGWEGASTSPPVPLPRPSANPSLLTWRAGPPTRAKPVRDTTVSTKALPEPRGS